MCNRMKPQEESNPMAYDMTLRDQFAMAALTGMLANPITKKIVKPGFFGTAYEIADAMLEARKEKK